jgi:hypothetical protein
VEAPACLGGREQGQPLRCLTLEASRAATAPATPPSVTRSRCPPRELTESDRTRDRCSGTQPNTMMAGLDIWQDTLGGPGQAHMFHVRFSVAGSNRWMRGCGDSGPLPTPGKEFRAPDFVACCC